MLQNFYYFLAEVCDPYKKILNVGIMQTCMQKKLPFEAILYVHNGDFTFWHASFKQVQENQDCIKAQKLVKLCSFVAPAWLGYKKVLKGEVQNIFNNISPLQSSLWRLKKCKYGFL